MLRFLLLLLITGISLAAKGSDFSFFAVFRNFADNVYCFDESGNPVKSRNDQRRAKTFSSGMTWQITPDGRYQITDAAGHMLQGEPGEQIFPCAILQDKYYLISEKDFPFKTLIQWIPETGCTIPVGKTCEAELLQVLYDDQKILGIQYINGFCEFFDPEYSSLHQKICAQYPGSFPIWRDRSPVRGSEWLVELLLPDRLSIWVKADVSRQTLQKISDEPPLAESGKKSLITYSAGDGMVLTAVLSYPPARFGTRNLPLIVFPHGGPGSVEMPYFDPRVAAMTACGFLVLQPNYRGSSGQGKVFRFLGWQAHGIRASLNDIAQGARHLIDKGIADPHRIAILGGSWGGYCALASLCLYPELYRCGISLFGASDLPEMLRSFPQKSHANAALDRLQYGNVNDPDDEKALRSISPLFLSEKIMAPLLLIHYQQDQVIEFSQSERLFHKMKNMGKEIEFLYGDGEHGFQPPEKEAEIYCKIIDFIQQAFSR